MVRSARNACAAVSWIRSCNVKETAVSNVNTTPEQNAKTQKVELLDCGQASKMTKGFLFFFLFEGSVPPFDRQLIM